MHSGARTGGGGGSDSVRNLGMQGTADRTRHDRLKPRTRTHPEALPPTGRGAPGVEVPPVVNAACQLVQEAGSAGYTYPSASGTAWS